MPRQARLDAPGVLQHVMARGIERRKIFRDDKDRASFLERFAVILDETQTQCYAWALIPNHFHLLLRTGLTPLSTVMRRLMTGYAVSFNRRHRRAGHLFQNRYKSVVCEEDPYLLELIRYIHLNPLRAGVVKDLKELDKYPWTGHSTILGRRKNSLIHELPNQPDQPNRPNQPNEPGKSLAEKTVEDVLLNFDDSAKVARRRYRQFVKKEINQGRRPDLQGGGLVRSAGGTKSGLLGRKKGEREKGDERILGSGDFVVRALKEANELHERTIKHKVSLDELIKRVSNNNGIGTKDLLSSKRKQEISDARATISYLAAIELRYPGTKIAAALRLSEKSVSRCIERGKKLLDNDKKLLEHLQ